MLKMWIGRQPIHIFLHPTISAILKLLRHIQMLDGAAASVFIEENPGFAHQSVGGIVFCRI